jgi:hydroxypyruvate reductase
VTGTRRHALAIFRAALQAADPQRAVLQHVKRTGGTITIDSRRYRLDALEQIQVIGAGKASAAMGKALEKLLGNRITGGWINVPDGIETRLRRVHLHASGHPIPDQRGVEGAERILEIASQAGPRDLVICVISGGASALLPAPAQPLTLERKQAITRELLASGATIHEINTVRKHLSRIKGGRLARAAANSNLVSLILSDVVGDDLEVIGSGPTVGDRSTVEKAGEILQKYRIDAPLQALAETPKPEDPDMRRAPAVLVGSNRQAVDAAAERGRSLGYRTLVLSTTIEGETREIARMHAAIVKEILARGRPVRRPACVLSGGETTVTIRGKGSGGRNQEFVLAALLALDTRESFTLLSAGTDGIDGPTDAAGAMADEKTMARASKLGLDARAYLENNDSYRFFDRVKSLIRTGPTGTNVADIRIMLIH